MDEEYKSIRVKEVTHYRFKALAAKMGITHDEAVNALIEIYNRYEAQSRVPYFVAPGTAKDE